MRHRIAALAACLTLLASAVAGATTPWNHSATFDALKDVATTRTETVESGDILYWRPEDTDASPSIVVGPGGATAVWDDGAATENLTIEQATGSAASPGAWKTYGPPLVATSTCTTIDSCAIRYLLPGTYRFDTAGAATDGQLKLTGGK